MAFVSYTLGLCRHRFKGGYSRCRTHHCTHILSSSLLDVLTPLSDCRQEPVEKMERRTSGVSYMYWMDFYNEIFVVGFYVLD